MLNNILGSILKKPIKFIDKRRLPRLSGELTLPGLKEAVNVIRDEVGIPNIQASNDYDLFFTQGFLHAQDRLWQMELNRRTASGQLSEIFGDIALDTDRTARTFGWRRIGTIDWNNADDKLKEIIQAYVDGINIHITTMKKNLPVEFSLIGHKPRAWVVQDAMALMRFMIWQLSHAWYGEIIRAKLIDAVGPDNAKLLEITYPEENPITLPNNNEFNQYFDGILKKAKDPLLKQSLGSNSWVISKEKSATGSPILCNDMHLAMSLPALWYANHLQSENVNVTGVSIPGIPLVLVGHNDKIAWGMTLAFTDAEDLYIEKFSEDKNQYWYKDELHDFEIIKEVIKIKKKDDFIESIYYTRHGPIISDVVDKNITEHLSVCSKSLQSNNALRGWYKLNIATNWDDFTDAIRDIEAPQLNVPYADAENIGYWVTGRVPIRAKGHTGMVPVPGWDGKYEWQGEIPLEEMPHAFNPESGVLVSCNNKIVKEDYPHFLGNVWMNGYRAKRIEDYFSSKDKISIDDCIKMQQDFYCIPGVEFIKHYENIDSQDESTNQALQVMKQWDGYLFQNSIGGCLYSLSKYFVVRKLFEPLGKELTETIMGTGFHPILLPSHEFYGHDTVVLLNMLSNTDNWWINQAGGKEQLLRDGFESAVQWLQKNVSKSMNKWQWGSIHQIEFVHSMAIQKPMDVVFNLQSAPIGGDTDTPCQMAIFPNEPFNARSWIPSWRQIIHMGNLSSSLYMFAPGQSGRLSSKHYGDLREKWIKGEYNFLYWNSDEFKEKHQLTLIPE